MSARDQSYGHGSQAVYDIKSNAVRLIWAGYFIFVLLSSLIGDTTILVASIKHKAFKLHKMIIVIIQHIAVCDLMVSITDILPRLVSVIASEWMLGDLLCSLSSYGRYYFNPTSILLICTMTTSKLFILKFPLRSGMITPGSAHSICAACWLASCTIPAIGLIVDKRDVYFSYIGYQCAYGFSSDIWQLLKPIFTALFLFVPTSLVIATTINLLIIARQATGLGRETRTRQGTITTVLTAIIFSISVLPTAIHALPIYEQIFRKKPEHECYSAHFYRLASSFLALNTISNFYVYSLTVPSFREFVGSKIRRSYKFLMNRPASLRRGRTIMTSVSASMVNFGRARRFYTPMNAEQRAQQLQILKELRSKEGFETNDEAKNVQETPV